jgi:hypothetical protein
VSEKSDSKAVDNNGDGLDVYCVVQMENEGMPEVSRPKK